MEIVISIALGVLIALIIVGVMTHQMRPVAQKHEASQYTSKDDVKITVSEDRYLRTEVTKQKIERPQQQQG